MGIYRSSRKDRSRTICKVHKESIKKAPFHFEMTQTDNGPEFTKWCTHGWLRLGIKHRHGRVRKSNDRAHVERFLKNLGVISLLYVYILKGVYRLLNHCVEVDKYTRVCCEYSHMNNNELITAYHQLVKTLIINTPIIALILSIFLTYPTTGHAATLDIYPSITQHTVGDTFTMYVRGSIN